MRPRPPVRVLSHDILWQIFQLISQTDIEGHEDALYLLRSCSQVCYAWRDIILNTPTLWGRLISINRRVRPEWKEEVLRRSQSSPLHVSGCQYNLAKDKYFQTLFQEQWARFKCVDIDAASNVEDLDGGVVVEGAYRYFFRPAPALERFKFRDPTRFRTLLHDCAPTQQIFSGHAPILRHLHLQPGFNYFIFPCIPSLVELELFGNLHPTVHQILDALRSMPLLETLVMYTDPVIPSLGEHPDVELPHLKTFQTSESGSLDHLDHLLPAYGCALDIKIIVGPSHDGPLVQRIFLRYLDRYLSCHPSPKIVLCRLRCLIKLKGVDEKDATHPPPLSLVLITTDTVFDWHSFWPPYPCPVLGSITWLEYDSGTQYPPFAEFYDNFTGVKELELTDTGMIKFFHRENNPGIFPSLRTVIVHDFRHCGYYIQLLSSFIERRARQNNPILELRIRDSRHVSFDGSTAAIQDYPLIQEFLQFEGLRFVWLLWNDDSITYIVGSDTSPVWDRCQRQNLEYNTNLDTMGSPEFPSVYPDQYYI